MIVAACIALLLSFVSNSWIDSTVIASAAPLLTIPFMALALYLYLRPALTEPRAHQLAQLNSSQEKTREKIQTVERHMLTYAHSEALIEQAKKNKEEWRKRIRLEIEADQQKVKKKLA